MHRAIPLIFLLVAGCPGLGQVGFDVASQGTSTVQGSPLGAALNAFPSFSGFGDLSFSQSQDFANNNTNKDHVVQANLTRLTLKTISPTGATLDFIQTVEFDIAAPGLPTVRIAEATIAAGATSVDLSLDAQDLAAYVKADSFSITTKGAGHQPSSDTTIEADLSLHIVANVL